MISILAMLSGTYTNEISNDINMFRIKLVLLSGLKLQSKLKTLKLYCALWNYWAKCYYEITEPLNYPHLILKLPVWHTSYLNSTCVVPINLEPKQESYHGIWWWWSPCGDGKFDLSHHLLTVAVAAGSTGYDADTVEVDDGSSTNKELGGSVAGDEDGADAPRRHLPPVWRNPAPFFFPPGNLPRRAGGWAAAWCTWRLRLHVKRPRGATVFPRSSKAQ
jgi:hypothetical protein